MTTLALNAGLNLTAPLKHGPWKLTELADIPKNGFKVFSCFHCGGGSTMGYKLAGYEVLGGVEIDPEMMAVYKVNHNPKHSYLMAVQEFKKIPNEKLPEELFNLDILDGSPPCSSFSMAGAREKKWGQASKFREGQAVQNLDDLFFDFIDVAAKLKPKVVVAENVKGLIQGNARGYVKQIFKNFDAAGYSTQLFLLNAAAMGVPQKRERTFFIATRKDLNLPKIVLMFNEPVVTIENIVSGINTTGPIVKTPYQIKQWDICPAGAGAGADVSKGGFNTQKKLHPKQAALTQTGTSRHFHWSEKCWISDELVIRIQSFPEDFNFLSQDAQYICGMSVPPFMMQRVALQIEKQLLRSKNGSN